MSLETPPVISNQEDKITRFRKETNERVKRLLASGMPTKEITDLLGAEEFLTLEKVGRASPVLRFDVKSFIEREVSRGVYLQLPSDFFKVSETILPPDEGEIIKGSGKGMEKKQIVPRSRALVEVLSEVQEDYFVVEGVNMPNMTRGLSYKIFIIPKLEKMIFVNDEEGNATFVIHNVSQNQDAWRKYATQTKEELRAQEQTKVTTIIYRDDINNWKEEIKLAIIASPLIIENTKKKAEEKRARAEQRLGFEKAPANWLLTDPIAKELGKAFKTVKARIETYRSAHPEWFRNYLDVRGQLGEHYHPDLVKIVKDYFLENTAPEGWMTKTPLSETLGKSKVLIKKIAERYRILHPEWFHDYLGVGEEGWLEYYHPDLIGQIMKDVNELGQKAPAGWLTTFPIAKQLGRSFNMVKNKLETYRSTHPEWCHNYLDNSGKPREHYHPDLVQKIKDDLKK